MNQTIESDKLLVKDAFQKWYRIPEYQRPYVWGSDQVIEILDDIYRARQANPDSQYFLGSMVLKKSTKQNGSTKYEEYDLLDGQQRLTTLFLITAVIRDLTPSSNTTRINTCRDTIYQMANPDDGIPERSRIVFDIRDKVRDFVEQYVKPYRGTQKIEDLKIISRKSDEDISIRNMANAILTIYSFFENGNSIDEFFPFFRSNVLIIYVAAEELEDAFHLFTVMNNRGVKLRNSDILKAENLSKITHEEERTKYAKMWEGIEEYFAEDFDNFLSHLRTVLVKQKAGYNLLREYEENIYAPKEFDRNTKTYISKPPLLIKGKSTFDFIDKYYKNYRTLFEKINYDSASGYEICNQITLMRMGFEADYWIAPLLRYHEEYKNNGLLDFIHALDRKFSSDWIIGLSPTKRIENVNAIIKEIEETVDPTTLLNSPVFNVERQDLPKVFSQGIYGRRYGRYLLLKMDLLHHGHTTKFSPPPTISIEHILPQNPSQGSKWSSDYTEDDRIKWTNRIGNLILLSRRKNSTLSNLDYCEKRQKYFQGNIELFSNSIRIMQEFEEWKLNNLRENHIKTLGKLLLSYGINMPSDELGRLVD